MEAKKIIKIIKKPNGAVTILDVAKALADINDEGQDIIRFVKKGLPHCGLVYLSKSLTKIQEAKTTLSFLASERFRLVKCIA